MKTVNMILTEESATKMDEILKSALVDDPFVEKIYKDETERYEYMTIFDQLEELELGNKLNDSEFQVYPKGFSFVQNGGFIGLYKEKKEQQEREKRQDLLTQSQIKAAKREPFLIIWSIITTISTLVLAWLQFIKG